MYYLYNVCVADRLYSEKYRMDIGYGYKDHRRDAGSKGGKVIGVYAPGGKDLSIVYGSSGGSDRCWSGGAGRGGDTESFGNLSGWRNHLFQPECERPGTVETDDREYEGLCKNPPLDWGG